MYRDAGEGGFALTAVGDAEIVGLLGEGVTCAVHAARWRGRDVALKLYKAGAVERHVCLVGEDPARYEFRRNRAFYEVPELARYVAAPLAYLTTGGVSAFIQERLVGDLYCRVRHSPSSAAGHAPVDESLFAHVRRIVSLAHAAGLYDIDLHAANLMVVEEDGGPVPKLFDFNFIPFYEHPPNPFVRAMLAFGLIDRSWRDLRKLREFHDYRRIERKQRLLQDVRAASNGNGTV